MEKDLSQLGNDLKKELNKKIEAECLAMLLTNHVTTIDNVLAKNADPESIRGYLFHVAYLISKDKPLDKKLKKFFLDGMLKILSDRKYIEKPQLTKLLLKQFARANTHHNLMK